MTLLVTGTSGRLGRLIVLALLDRGVPAGEIVATARDTGAISDLEQRGVLTRRLDYDDPASGVAALADVDRMVLVSSSVIGNRVAQHRNVIEAATKQQVELIAYTSILHADTSSVGLAVEHRGTEDVLASSGLPYVLLRNGWYLENYTGQAAAAVERGTVLGAAGEGRISAAARADYAEAAAVALTTTTDASTGVVHELAGDESFSMAEYVALLSQISGKEITYTDLAPQQYAAALEQVGLPAPVAEMIADNDRAVAAGDLLDETHALSALLQRPTTTLADALGAALR